MTKRNSHQKNFWIHFFNVYQIFGGNKMKKLELLSHIIEITSNLISQYEFLCRSRTKTVHFSREGKIGFVNLVGFMLNFVKKTLQMELDNYFKLIDKDKNRITKQAFSEARKKLSFKPFKELYDLTTKAANEADDMTTFKGYRVCAIDGTSLAVENSDELLEYFGSSGAGGRTATARASALYDVYNDILMDVQLEKYSCGERELAYRHIKALKELGAVHNVLIIFDRGYISNELIAFLIENGIHFLIRVRQRFNSVIDKTKAQDSSVSIAHNENSYKLRVIKFTLPSEEIETLITDLPQSEFEHSEFKELYFKRWPIETKYDLVKNKLQLENFTGKTVLSVYQDFYAGMYLTNVAAFAKYISDKNISNSSEGKNLKHEYQTNTNMLIGKLKDNLVLALLEDNPRKREKMIKSVLIEISLNKVPIRKNRQVERKVTTRKRKFHICKKSSL